MDQLRSAHRASSRGVLTTGLCDQDIATSECGKGLPTVSVQQLQPIGACRHCDDKLALAWQRSACSSDSGQECIGYINETARGTRPFSPLHLISHTLAPILIHYPSPPKESPSHGPRLQPLCRRYSKRAYRARVFGQKNREASLHPCLIQWKSRGNYRKQPRCPRRQSLLGCKQGILLQAVGLTCHL